MFNNKNVRGVWWACAAVAAVLGVGCVSAVSEESSGSAPVADGSGGSGSVGGAASSSVSSSSSAADSPPSLPGGVITTGVEEATTTTTTMTVVQVGEENGGGEPAGGVVSVEVRVSEEGLERLRRVLGEDKFAAVVEEAEWYDEELLVEFPSLGVDSGVWLGRLAGGNGFLTEEGLGKLAERRSVKELAFAAQQYSEEVLAVYANEDEERMAGPLDVGLYDSEGSYDDRGFLAEYSDEEVKGSAFTERAEAVSDDRLWDDNVLSTPVGAFCWAVLRVRHIEDWTDNGIGGGFRPWQSRNLLVWHFEREAEERGIELEWETSPLDANRVLRRVLLDATAPGVRSVVFDSGLPSVLRPAAEALYSLYDELLALPLRRVRPRVEELSGYRRVQDLTEEEIVQIWPDEFEIDYREEDEEKYLDAMGMLRDDAVRELLNAECKKRPAESTCPPWEASETSGWGFFGISCNDIEDIGPISSCPLFYKADPRKDGYATFQSECTVNEEAEEALERLSEVMKREMGR